MKKIYPLATLIVFFSLVQQIFASEPARTTACSVQVMSVNVTCNGASNGTAWAIPSGGIAPYTYSWSGTAATTDTITGLAPGTYTVTVTDGSSCVSSASAVISEPLVLSAIISSHFNASCFGMCDGGAIVGTTGGTAPFTYSWTGGTMCGGQGTGNPSALSAGTYTVLVMDAGGCTTTATTIISQPTVLAASISNQVNLNCFGKCIGKATVAVTGGTPIYSYAWSPNTGSTTTGVTDSLLCAGTYTVNVTDANGCSAYAGLTITQPAQLGSSILSKTNLPCNARCRGIAVVGATGGTGSYTYSWMPVGGTKDTATRLCAGTSTVTITDQNGCVKMDSVLLTEPAVLAATTSQVNQPCNGGSTGSASVTPSGGTAPYTYSWVPTASPTGLKAGPEICFLTDSNGCRKTIPFNITQPALIRPVISVKPASCGTCLDGRDSVTVTGGKGTLTYSWSPGTCTSPACSGLAAGTYTCCVTDSAGCNACQTVTLGVTGIVEHEAPVMFIYPNPAGQLLNIEVPAQLETGTLSLYDAVGSLVREIKSFKSASLDVSGLVPGTYILRLDYAGGSMHKLFVKQ